MTNELIEKIKQQTLNAPDDVIDGESVCDIFDVDGNNIETNGAILTLTSVDENGELTIWGTNERNGKNVCFQPEDLNEKILDDIALGLTANKNTNYKNAVVRQRTREVANEMKKRFDALIEKAFNTGAFDWDEAFRNGYVIPKAIVAAAAKTVMEECCNYDCEIVNEKDNIYQFL